MLYGEQAARDNIRNRAGRRVIYLDEGDRLTPAARDFLRREGIEILPAAEASPALYHTADGRTLPEKPEHMTHLRGNTLVSKTAPVIAFRGAMDTLQARLLLAQAQAPPALRRELGQVLALARSILRWEVMEEPAEGEGLCGLTWEQLRRHSQQPQRFYGQTHFMPEAGDGKMLLLVNLCRCTAREAELAAARAFDDGSGGCTRPDLLRFLNRMSSMLYILMLRLRAEGNGGTRHVHNSGTDRGRH